MRPHRNCYVCSQCINCSQEYHTTLNRTVVCYKQYKYGKYGKYGKRKKKKMKMNMNKMRDEIHISIADILHVIFWYRVMFDNHDFPDQNMPEFPPQDPPIYSTYSSYG